MGSGGSHSLRPPGKPVLPLQLTARKRRAHRLGSEGWKIRRYVPLRFAETSTSALFRDQTGWVLYGQASRAISTGKLHALLRFHTRPINVVVFDDPSGTSRVQGDLILRGASRLDAFSGYPFRT